jgi:hypothetical protein
MTDMEEREIKIYRIGGLIVFILTWLITAFANAKNYAGISIYLGFAIAIAARYIIWPILTMILFAACAAARHFMKKE